MLELASWLLVTQVLALAVLPLTIRAFQALPDCGYGFSKTLGLVVVGYLAWLFSMLGFTSFSRATIIALSVGLGVACWWQWGSRCAATALDRWRVMLTMELVFVLAFGFGVFVRAFSPDISGQEKFMDFALMNTFLTAGDLPTHDPWLAGYGVPYYHLGYLILGVPAKIAATPGPVAYNLAVAFIFAAGFAGAVTVVYSVLASQAPRAARVQWPALMFGLLGGAMVMLLGNLEAVLELAAATGWGDEGFWRAAAVKGLAPAQGGGLLPTDVAWWWRASRVIPNIEPDGITEFPYFSFLLGDLHPHYIAIALNLVIVGLAIAAWLRDPRQADAALIAVTALLLAVLVAANTWDVPTFWGLLLASAALAAWRRQSDLRLDRRLVTLVIAPFVLAAIAISPYFVAYQSQPLGLGVVRERTPLASMLILFGPLLVLAVVVAVWMIVHGNRQQDSLRSAARRAFFALIAAAAVAAIVLGLGEPTLALLASVGSLLAWAGWLWLGTRRPTTADWRSEAAQAPATVTLLSWLLATVSVALLIGVELVYVRDTFGTRMNTVFKLHYDVWLLLGLSGAAALGLLWRWGSGAWRIAALSLAALVVMPGLVYPLAATWTKSGQFAGEATLDGARFLRRGYPGDYEAIRWLRANAEGRPVVIEAIGPDYQQYARVSTFSGLPTVLGWVGHELQWRGDRPEYGRRQQDIEAVYRASTREELWTRAEPYAARFLFFGSLERDRYGTEAQERLGRLLPVAFTRGGTTVYSVAADAQIEE